MSEHPCQSSVIISVEYKAPYKLQLLFDDRNGTEVDFESFLRASRHPSIRAYLDKTKYKHFTVEDGFLHWNDFDLVFPIADLYAGKSAKVTSRFINLKSNIT